MKVLLDSHTFLWFTNDDPKLSETALATIVEPSNTLYFSVACAWELAIKTSLGKLTLTQPYATFLPEQLRLNGIRLLPIRVPHIQRTASLPFHHKDPFDRLLIAQSLTENIPIISADATFDAYGVTRIWRP